MSEREIAGKIEFCALCKRLVDYALATDHRNNLYIEINKEVPAPGRRTIIPVCENCTNMLKENLPGVDGFIIEF